MVGMKRLGCRLACGMFAVLAAWSSRADVQLAPDAAFGGSGVATLSTANHESFVAAHRLADGAIVAAGNLGTATGSDLVVARFRANGSLDPAFGFGGYSALDAGSADDTARALALLPDGRIAVAGQSGGRPMVAVFRADGAPDANFGTGGVVRVPLLNSSRAGFAALTVQSDGMLVAAGEALAAGGPQPLIARFDGAGALDTGFDDDGVRVLSGLQATAVHVRAVDGALLIAARGAGRVLVARIAADGRLDASFGAAGIAETATPVSSPLAGFVAESGRLLVAERKNGRFVEFDGAGRYARSVSVAPGAELAALARAADGTLLVALDLPDTSGFKSAIGSLGATPDGTLVLRSTVDLPGAAGSDSTAVLALHADAAGRGVAAGYRYGSADTDYLLAAFSVRSAATVAPSAPAPASVAAVPTSASAPAGGGGSADVLLLAILAAALLALPRRRG
jgi:uncharacterized delta-60 repeat protein